MQLYWLQLLFFYLKRSLFSHFIILLLLLAMYRLLQGVPTPGGAPCPGPCTAPALCLQLVAKDAAGGEAGSGAKLNEAKC